MVWLQCSVQRGSGTRIASASAVGCSQCRPDVRVHSAYQFTVFESFSCYQRRPSPFKMFGVPYNCIDHGKLRSDELVAFQQDPSYIPRISHPSYIPRMSLLFSYVPHMSVTRVIYSPDIHGFQPTLNTCTAAVYDWKLTLTLTPEKSPPISSTCHMPGRW
jgi:hypothetical protein